MATQQRSITDKIADARRVAEAFRDDMTPDKMRDMVAMVTDQQHQAAAEGNVEAYAELVRASIGLMEIMYRNDRAALLAAAIITQSGVVKPVITEE